jgi:hypothetical protein
VEDIIIYNNLLGKNVYVIDIFRSPIERKISEFFEQISTLHFNNSEKNINNYNVNKVINRFNHLFPYLGNTDYYKERYNLLHFPETFDFNNKYILQNVNGIKYIKLRLKDSHEWGNILTFILNVPIIIVTDYTTDNKPLANLFRSFKELYRIPVNFLNDIRNCPSLTYYYNFIEREEYLNTWNSKTTELIIPYTPEQYILYNQISLENQTTNDIQREHYIDIGCLCIPCSIKRNILLSKAQRGEKITEKIIHNDAVNEIKKVINNKNKLLQERISKINNLIQHNNSKLNRTSSNTSILVKNNMINTVNK